MHKIDDSLFCQTCKCVCSKWNCLTWIICFNACHFACSLLNKPQQLWNFKKPFIVKIVYQRFCLFKVCLTFNLLSPDLIIYIPAAYQTLIHMKYIMYTTHILVHLIWIRCTKITTNFSVFHLNICSLAKNFYKLQDFVSILDKAPSCIAISETRLNSGSAIGEIQLQNNTFTHKPSSARAGGVGL